MILANPRPRAVAAAKMLAARASVVGATRSFRFALFFCAAIAGPGALGVALASLVQWMLANRSGTPVPDGDLAVLELYTLQATKGQQLTGPYSRFGWHHPGPIYFYLMAPLYQLTAHDPVSLQLSALTIGTISCLAILLISFRHHPLAIFCSVAILLPAVVAAPGPGFFANPWNPYVTVLPFALFIVLCVELCLGHGALLPAAVGVGSFLIQTHISYTPLVGMFSLATLLVWTMPAVRERLGLPARKPTVSAFWTVISVVLGGLIWLPVAVEEITRHPGNLTLLFEFFTASRYPAHGLAEAFDALARQLPGPMLLLARIAGRSATTGGSTAPWDVFAVLQVALLHLAFLQALRLRQGYRAVLGAFGTLGFWVALWATLHIEGELESYLIVWASALGLIQWIAIASVLVPTAAGGSSSWLRRFRPAGALAALVSVLLIADVSLRASPIGSLFPTEQSNRYRALATHLEEYLGRVADGPFLIQLHHPIWPSAAAIILQLEKAGVPIHVDAAWVPMFGAPLSPSGKETTDIVITDRSADAPRPNPLVDHVVADDPTIRIFVHRDLLNALEDPGSPEARSAYRVGSQLVLLDTSLANEQSVPGDTLHLQVRLLAVSALSEHMMIVGRLIDWNGAVRAEADTPVVPLDRPPMLQRGDLKQDRLAVPLPTSLPRGLYRVQLVFFRVPSWATLPTSTIDGRRVEQLDVGTILVAYPDDLPTGTISGLTPLGAQLGDVLALVGAGPVEVRPDALDLALYWQARLAPGQDYSVFVQLLDANGKLVAQSDGFPWNGGYPTSAWQPGRIVRDSYELPLPRGLPNGRYTLIAGAYLPATMQRLPVVDARGITRGDFVRVATLRLPCCRDSAEQKG